MSELSNFRRRTDRVRSVYTGRTKDNRIAWARLISGLWEIIELPPIPVEGQMEGYALNGYRMKMPLRNGRYEQYTLTVLTEKELIALRSLWEHAFKLALPVVQERDREAAHAAAQGDDSYRRIYRQLPEFHIRTRKVKPHSSSVLDGSSDVSEGLGDDGSSPGGLPEAGSGVADDQPEDPEGSNDESQAD